MTSPALSLASLPAKERAAWLASLTDSQAAALRWSWDFFARPEQLAPDAAWSAWLILAGRGWGKTRTGAEWVRHQVESKAAGRIALVGATSADIRDVMIEGPSGLMVVCPPWNRPTYEPSKRRVTWPNGAVATAYSADEPDRLRGPQHDAAWCDEIAAWRYDDAWDQLRFGLRIGVNPRIVATTTPRPTALVRNLLAEKTTVVTKGATYDNRENLAPEFFSQIIAKYEGTRLGRQEIYADLLEDVPGALWQRSDIDKHRVSAPPSLRRVVVAVDPAVSSGETADETGIIVIGVGDDRHGYILADLSRRVSPDAWARRVVDAYHQFQADRVIAEVNNGGDLVEKIIRTVDERVSYKSVRATRGKVTRAEPAAALYEQGKVHHVGTFAGLEDQLCVFTSEGSRRQSPDRVDALVWGLTETLLNNQFATFGPFDSSAFQAGLRHEPSY